MGGMVIYNTLPILKVCKCCQREGNTKSKFEGSVPGEGSQNLGRAHALLELQDVDKVDAKLCSHALMCCISIRGKAINYKHSSNIPET